MKKVYIERFTKRNFNELRTYLLKCFHMNKKSIRKVKANIKAGLDYFVIEGVIFENRRAY